MRKAAGVGEVRSAPEFAEPVADPPVGVANFDAFAGDEQGERRIALRVAEAELDDVDRGNVRIDPYLLARIGLQAPRSV